MAETNAFDLDRPSRHKLRLICWWKTHPLGPWYPLDTDARQPLPQPFREWVARGWLETRRQQTSFRPRPDWLVALTDEGAVIARLLGLDNEIS